MSLAAVSHKGSDGQYGRDDEEKNRRPPQENIGIAVSHYASLNSPEMNKDEYDFRRKKV